jgi:hypothetical protein
VVYHERDGRIATTAPSSCADWTGSRAAAVDPRAPDRSDQRRSLGGHLLVVALRRCVRGDREFGARAVIVTRSMSRRPRSTPLRLPRTRRPPPVAAIGGRRAHGRRVDRRHRWRLWWQWTTRPQLVMTDISKTARPDLLLAGGDELDGPVGALAALSTITRIPQFRSWEFPTPLGDREPPLNRGGDSDGPERLGCRFRRCCGHRSRPCTTRN